MIRERWVKGSMLLVALALWLLGGCDAGALVGGGCAEGYLQCGNRCIDVQNDVNNCGACDYSCDAGKMCTLGSCVLYSGGAAGSGGSTLGGAAGRATAGTGGAAGAGGLGNGGSGAGSGMGTSGAGGVMAGQGGLGGAAGSGASGGSIGSGGSIASGGSIGSGGDGGTGAPPVMCEEPAVACGASCVDPSNDPAHCGSCFNRCPSGLCAQGSCIGETPGHIVALCMNLRQATVTSTSALLLGNAALLPLNSVAPTRPVRILAYGRYGDNAAMQNARAAIEHVATQRGRSVHFTILNDAVQVSSQLKRVNFEVFLMHDQPSAPLGTLAPLGSGWAALLDTFVKDGGTAIVMSGGLAITGDGQMDDFLTSARLLNVSSERSASFEIFYNRAPTDAVGLGVVSPFLSVGDSCVFQTPAPVDLKTVFVVTDTAPPPGSGHPWWCTASPELGATRRTVGVHGVYGEAGPSGPGAPRARTVAARARVMRGHPRRESEPSRTTR